MNVQARHWTITNCLVELSPERSIQWPVAFGITSPTQMIHVGFVSLLFTPRKIPWLPGRGLKTDFTVRIKGLACFSGVFSHLDYIYLSLLVLDGHIFIPCFWIWIWFCFSLSGRSNNSLQQITSRSKAGKISGYRSPIHLPFHIILAIFAVCVVTFTQMHVCFSAEKSKASPCGKYELRHRGCSGTQSSHFVQR